MPTQIAGPSGPRQTILVVDDEEPIRQMLELYLTHEGFEVATAGDGAQAVKLHASRHPDLVILDLMLPGMDGWEVCRRIRGISRVPIIMLSAHSEETDRVVGLEMGADDYVTKPFSPREVIARVRAVLRRQTRGRDDHAAIALPGLRLDYTAQEAKADGELIPLTRTEFELLWHLASQPGQVHSRAGLLDRAWAGAAAPDARTVDAHVMSLRRKLTASQCRCQLTTIWGVGYRLDTPARRPEATSACSRRVGGVSCELGKGEGQD
jgi:two-component system, OmpR family, response regulator ResD